MDKQSKILIDIGSSTVKAYKILPESNTVELFLQHSIFFKEGFDPENGISGTDRKELFEFINDLKNKNPGVESVSEVAGV